MISGLKSFITQRFREVGMRIITLILGVTLVLLGCAGMFVDSLRLLSIPSWIADWLLVYGNMLPANLFIYAGIKGGVVSAATHVPLLTPLGFMVLYFIPGLSMIAWFWINRDETPKGRQ